MSKAKNYFQLIGFHCNGQDKGFTVDNEDQKRSLVEALTYLFEENANVYIMNIN